MNSPLHVPRMRAAARRVKAGGERFLGGVLPGATAKRLRMRAFADEWAAANLDAQQSTGPLWIVLGDGASQGIGATTREAGYVGVTHQLLRRRDAWRVINLSRSGAGVLDVLARQLPELVALTARQPAALVSCLIGVEDMARRTPGLETALRQVVAALPVGSVVGLLPHGPRTAGALNSVIREEAERHGMRIAVLPPRLPGALRGPGGRVLGDVGHAAWARAVLAAADGPVAEAAPATDPRLPIVPPLGSANPTDPHGIPVVPPVDDTSPKTDPHGIPVVPALTTAAATDSATDSATDTATDTETGAETDTAAGADAGPDAEAGTAGAAEVTTGAAAAAAAEAAEGTPDEVAAEDIVADDIVAEDVAAEDVAAEDVAAEDVESVDSSVADDDDLERTGDSALGGLELFAEPARVTTGTDPTVEPDGLPHPVAATGPTAAEDTAQDTAQDTAGPAAEDTADEPTVDTADTDEAVTDEADVDGTADAAADDPEVAGSTADEPADSAADEIAAIEDAPAAEDTAGSDIADHEVADHESADSDAAEDSTPVDAAAEPVQEVADEVDPVEADSDSDTDSAEDDVTGTPADATDTEDVAAEDVAAEDVAAEDVAAEEIAAEDATADDESDEAVDGTADDTPRAATDNGSGNGSHGHAGMDAATEMIDISRLGSGRPAEDPTDEDDRTGTAERVER